MQSRVENYSSVSVERPVKVEMSLKLVCEHMCYKLREWKRGAVKLALITNI